MKLHIMGASGSGVTTLGSALANRLNVPYFDSDEYFWVKTDPPFLERRQPELRNELIVADTLKHSGWIIGGSLLKWDIEIAFDLIVFLYIPNEIRMERLQKREYSRYGHIILTDETRKRQYHDFMNWVNGYDDNSTQGRNLAAHEDWLQQQVCPILELRGDYTVNERMGFVLNKLRDFQ